MTTTLRVELQVRDYDMWRAAFERDAAGRERHGAREYRIFRPLDDDKTVMLDLDFSDADQADGFLQVMKRDVWPNPEKAPAKLGVPKTRIARMVESHTY